MKKIVEQVCSFYYGHRKKLLMMRNAVLIILISAFQVLATGSYSQTAQLSLKMKDATIKNVLIEIENQSEFYFLYNSELIDVTRKVDISANKEKVNDILSRLFSDDEVNISITDRHIVLTPVAEKSSQQQNSVSGKVTDSSNLPLPGVTVVVMGTTAGSVTNADGRYTLANITENAILQFSFIGMQTQEIPVKSQSLINVILRAENVEIEEIVAIGYGTESAKRVSGSISKVSEKDFNKGVNRNAADMLQGKVAGLTITQDGGYITSTQTIRLRGTSSLTGSSSPFVVIDGISGLDMWSIAPDDIESISVLKDASATAIYGSRSASGVILITTKKGKGGQANIQYNGYLATDLEMDAEDNIKYYRSRFQIEFLYRDGKQHTGLEHSQARSTKKLHFHFNTSLTSINIARVCHWLSLPKEKREAYSMADVKTLYHNMLLLERFIDVFAVNPNKLKNQDIVKELIYYGTIAA